jgi:hypothetical protein
MLSPNGATGRLVVCPTPIGNLGDNAWVLTTIGTQVHDSIAGLGS